MGCGGDREKGPPEHTQKWAFITLSDFKATSAWPSLAYIWLWAMAFVAVAVYTVDTFTAVNLLAFNKWSSQVKPAIDFKYSKLIFAVCILLSWVLCFYEWFRAIRVIKRGGVAESYMDTLAVTLQSMRPGGWRRFLVFTELTKSKKGADYVAFFVYFAFNGALRVILCEGPRQFVNGMTLYAVMQADLLAHGFSTGQHNSFDQFFLNMGALAEKDRMQAVILFSMLFTLVIWVFSALSLIAAAILYLVFLWHYIPQRDGRLKVYCRRKVDRRLEKIVEHKVKAAIEEEERKKQKAEMKAELKRQKTDMSLSSKASKDSAMPPKPLGAVGRQPTLPQLGQSPEMSKDDKLPEFGLARQDTSTTVSTLPRYESRPPTRNGTMHSAQSVRRQPALPDMNAERPGMPSRTGTGSQWSQQSFESNAPLLANAGYVGEGGRGSPAPSYGRPMPGRTMTQNSQFSQQSRPFSPMSNNGLMYNRPPPGPRGPPVRTNTGFSFDTEPRSAVSPITPHDAYGRPLRRQGTQESFATAPSMMSRNGSEASFTRPLASQQPQMERRPTYGSLHSQQSSFSRPFPSQRRPSPPRQEQPTPLEDSYEMTTQPSYTALQPATTQPPSSGYVAFNPSMANSSVPTPPPPSSTPSQLMPGPKRNITVSGDPGANGNYFGAVREELTVPQRSAAAFIDPRHTTGYADIISDYGEPSARNSISPPALPSPSSEPVRGVSPLGGNDAPSVGASVKEGLGRHVSSVYSQSQFASPTHSDFEVEPMPMLPRAHTATPPAVTRWQGGDGRTDSWERSAANRF